MSQREKEYAVRLLNAALKRYRLEEVERITRCIEHDIAATSCYRDTQGITDAVDSLNRKFWRSR